QQQPAVPPALDVGLAVGARLIPNRQINDAEVEFGGAEQQVEITERIEITEVGAVAGNRLVIRTEENLRSAQRILDRLPEKPTERSAKKLVRHHVEEAHGLL